MLHFQNKMSISVVEVFKKFDAYPKTLEDFRIKTFSGGTITVISAIVMLLLFASEIQDYLTPGRCACYQLPNVLVMNKIRLDLGISKYLTSYPVVADCQISAWILMSYVQIKNTINENGPMQIQIWIHEIDRMCGSGSDPRLQIYRKIFQVVRHLLTLV